MENLLEKKIAESKVLPLVPKSGLIAYQSQLDSMINMVNAELDRKQKKIGFVSDANVQMMHDNHKNHGAFMAAVFAIGGYSLLTRTIPWVYKAYGAHGFTLDYFQEELQTWKSVLQSHLRPHVSTEILAVYDWMYANHSCWIELSRQPQDDPVPVGEEWMEIKNRFKACLLTGDFQSAMNLARNYTQEKKIVLELYTQIIQPAMYEIGVLWEKGEISVAQEHLASAVVSRVMAGINPSSVENNMGVAVVTASPGEFHELGAWMLSDILTQEGWDVDYLGANTPQNDLIDFIKKRHPDLLALSVTMAFNIPEVQNIISEVRLIEGGRTKILVGGRIFIDNPELEQTLDVDGIAKTLERGVEIVRNWSK